MRALASNHPVLLTNSGKVAIRLETDQLGRDILSRIIAGSRVSVLVGVVSVLISGTIGVIYGLISGFVGGILDSVLMRIVDGLLSIPFIILVIAISGIVGAGLSTLILILGFTGWITYARVIRGRGAESPRNGLCHGRLRPRAEPPQGHVSAHPAQCCRLRYRAGGRAGGRHHPGRILAELPGLGRQAADRHLGLDALRWPAIHQQRLVDDRLFPGIAITITVLGVVFLGDWLRDFLDPNVRGRA